MIRTISLLTFALCALALGAGATTAAAADYVPGKVLVRHAHQASTQEISTRAGESPRAAARRLQRDPGVAWARPNYIAHVTSKRRDSAPVPFTPNDPLFAQQWNLRGSYGINMPLAWARARQAGAPGGRGAVVAVVDTGVAYQRYKRFRRAPDLHHFVKGYDFRSGDRHPNDENGHGTHIAGTIAQSTNNALGTAGIAYRAKIMPVRVLDSRGRGNTIDIARGIRYAARHGADVINLSIEFQASVRASQIPEIASALRYAKRKRVLVVGATGNRADTVVAYPARAKYVMAIGATTIRGCQADYSNSGAHLDLAAPGGGLDARAETRDAYDAGRCRPRKAGPTIFQQTFTSSLRRFGYPTGYEGTSMAAPHVAGVAALVIASGQVGYNPRPADVEHFLERTARDIGPAGYDRYYGHGLLDAAAALDPANRDVSKFPRSKARKRAR